MFRWQLGLGIETVLPTRVARVAIGHGWSLFHLLDNGEAGNPAKTCAAYRDKRRAVLVTGERYFLSKNTGSADADVQGIRWTGGQFGYESRARRLRLSREPSSAPYENQEERDEPKKAAP